MNASSNKLIKKKEPIYKLYNLQNRAKIKNKGKKKSPFRGLFFKKILTQ